MKDELRKILSYALEEVSPMLTEQVSYSDDLILWSNTDGLFDSMALITFIGTVEVMIADTLGKDITIVSEKAFSQGQSPFKSMETLSHFIEELLEETR